MSVTPTRARWRTRVVLALGSLAVALALAELVTRTWVDVKYRRPVRPPSDHGWTRVLHQRSEMPGLTYELRPGAEGVEKDCRIVVNALGMRGPMPATPKPARTLRIATLGDSVAFGFGVEEPQMFPVLLGTRLNARSERAHDYEVLDLAVTGYSTREEASVLEHKALPLDPDLVLVAYYLNDPDFGPIHALRMAFHEPEWWERSHLLRLAAGKRQEWTEARLGGGDYYRWLHERSTPQWRSVLDGFARMRELCDARSLRVVLAIFPTFKGFTSWSEYPYAELHAQVRAAGEAQRFVVLDLLEVYRASGEPPSRIARDPDHPGPIGHALAAQALAELLLAQHEALFGVAP
jgi:hypothetical protein